MKDFRKLKVWEKPHTLTLRIYQATETFPDSERYGLTNQMRRSSASIPTNIAEGCGRDTDADFARFIQIAVGSASELEYQLILSHDLKFLSDTDYHQLEQDAAEVKKMLIAFLKQLRK